MRNFILFIRRFFNLILFLALEIVCTIFISHTNTLQGNDIVSSANTVSGFVYKNRNDVLYYLSLTRMNDSLVNENARLRTLVDQYRSADTLKDTLVRKLVSNDTLLHIIKYDNYIYRQARVIDKSVNAGDNYITIDRGYSDGIRQKMAVISGTGVAGRVEHVSAHYASVLTILSSKLKISAKLKDGTNRYVTWDEKNPEVLVMRDVPEQVKVHRGDSVYTWGVSIFSPDIMVGTVLRGELDKKRGTQVLYLQSSTNFSNFQYVYVLENTMEKEQRQVEDSSAKSKQ